MIKTFLFLVGLQMGLGQTFTNPIFDRNSADPAILKVGNFYYLTLSENMERELTIYKSPVMTDFRNAPTKVAITAPPGFSDLWASEMHLIDGGLYLYFTIKDNLVLNDHRMYVIKADDPTDPMGNWGPPIRLMPDYEYGAIDGTPMKHNGKLYFLFATWSFGPLSIYIAPMDSPTSVGSPKVPLKAPSAPWECHGGCTNEGPYFIYRNNVSYCVFSASSTWDPNYSLAVMSIRDGQDPLDVGSWLMPQGPSFTRNDAEGVYTTGHAAFTVSPDETETWMVYHATVDQVNIDGFRIARLEKIDWTVDGLPIFPRPHGYNNPQHVPSGQEF